jgi:hypothetical protein
MLPLRRRPTRHRAHHSAAVGLCALLALVALCACKKPPGSRTFEPESNAGKALARQARHDVWPDQVRADPAKYAGTLVAWAGIVTERRVLAADRTLAIVIAHHYWDFIEDLGPQREHMFLSPRGEGRFAIGEWVNDQTLNPGFLPVGAMAVVYGKPVEVTEDGLVVLEYKWSVTVQEGGFGTDIWDYGRAYLDQGDRSDLKILRRF